MIGVNYANRGKLKNAAIQYISSYEILNEQRPNSLRLAIHCNNLGGMCKSNKDLDNSLKYYLEGYNIILKCSPDS